MRLKKSMAAGVAGGALTLLPSAFALAAENDLLEEIWVTGIRQTVAQGIQVRRDAYNITEAVIAEDIGKLPDNNVVESLQRLAGIQVTDRGAGETNTVLIRGLGDVSTTVNGRVLYSPQGRSVALADLSSALVNRIDVHKSRSAQHYENGIGGLVDVHTFRPFDFEGSQNNVSIRGVEQEQVGELDPMGSALTSHRWSTPAGEFGVLVNVSHATTRYRDQLVTIGARVPLMDQEQPLPGWMALQRIPPRVNGESVWEPGQEGGLRAEQLVIDGQSTDYLLSSDAFILNDVAGTRERPAGSLVLQFAPDERSTYTFDLLYSGYRNRTDHSMLFSHVDSWAWGDERMVNTYPGTNVVREREAGPLVTYTSGEYQRDATDTIMAGLQGEWQLTDNLMLRSDLAYQESEYETDFIAVRAFADRDMAYVSLDGRGGLRFIDEDGDGTVNLALPQDYEIGDVFESAGRDRTEAITFTSDLEYWTDNLYLPRVALGVRWDERDAKARGRGQAQLGLVGNAGGQDLSWYRVNEGFAQGKVDVPDRWVSANGRFLIDNREDVFDFYPTMDVNQAFTPQMALTERNASVYGTVTLDLELFERLLDVELGVRYASIETSASFHNFQTDELDVGVKTTTDKVLPNLMARYDLTEDLLLRLAYSESLRMPEFMDLNPVRRIADDLSAVGYNTALEGNPALEPVHSANVDLSLEWYFGQSSYAFGTLFYRDVTDLVVTAQRMEGDQLVVSRPENSADGWLAGLELGVTWFPEMLPGYWDGLGVIASATFMDSEQSFTRFNESEQRNEQVKLPFFGVSEATYNVSLAWERERFDARLSYIWRDEALNRNEDVRFANPLGIYRDAEERLDAQFSVRLDERLTVSFDATNLTDKPVRESYGGSELFSHNTFLYSRTFALGARYSF